MKPCALSTASAALALALGLGACERPVAPSNLRARLRALGRPNVVLVVVDTLRPDWTTPYGDPRNPTPELERWARRGAVFERVLAQSSWTKVSMASLLTSLWPHTHDVRATTDALGDAALSVAEVFRDAGYRTAAVQSNGWLEQSFGFQQGFDRYTFAGGSGLADRPSVWPHADNVYLEAERIVDAHPPESPLFLYLHFMDVHEYAAPPDLQRFGRDDRGAYVAAIAWVDEVLSRLRRRLDRAGLLGRTLLVLASDHGEAFGENGVHGHARNVLDAELRVPLVVRFPFPIRPLRIRAQVRNLDIAPTLLDLAGIPIPDAFEGRSLLPLLTGEEPAADRPSFAALTALLFADAALQESVCDGRWTFARAPGGGRERLFDQRVDPDDDVDLAQIETARAVALRARLDAHLAQPPAAGAAQRDVRIDPELAQKLRALGYLR